jgi:hypothetical protein
VFDKKETKMAGPWLYAIAKNAGRFFTPKGKPIPVSLESYEKLVRSGKIVEDAWWYIMQNWNNIEVADEVLIYSGDKDRGIIGYAIVQEEPKKLPDARYIHLEFDVDKCVRLLANPIPAPIVRQWARFPRRNVINLELHEDELHRLMLQKLKKRN